jgi:hypothetical protein
VSWHILHQTQLSATGTLKPYLTSKRISGASKTLSNCQDTQTSVAFYNPIADKNAEIGD